MLYSARPWIRLFAVFTAASFVEQTTPVTTVITHNRANASNVDLQDQDTDSGGLGGMMSWSPPASEELLYLYRVNLAADASGLSRGQLISDCTRGDHWLDGADER